MHAIQPLQEANLSGLRQFTDREIGAGYYSAVEIEEIFQRSQKNGVMFTLILTSQAGEILGVRITYPPGQWQKGKGQGLKPELWPHSLQDTAYFQSLFLAESIRGQGWGGNLSTAALKILKTAGTLGVVCHAWKESPQNSSARYLQKLGFTTIAEYPDYWKDVPYNCTRCLKPPCRCTAVEMYLDLEKLGALK